MTDCRKKMEVAAGFALVIFLWIFAVPADSSWKNCKNALAGAFQSGNAGVLNDCLPEKQKIHLSCPSLGISAGYYSKSQVIQNIRRILGGTDTIFFRWKDDGPEAGPNINATWKFVDKKTKSQRTAVVYVSFSTGKNRSMITQIRIVDRSFGKR